MLRAQMVELSWTGLRVPAIAVELGCSEKTVRRWLHRFNRSGLEGLEDLGGPGRKRRITDAERSRIIGLVKQAPPGRLTVGADGELTATDEAGPVGAGKYVHAGQAACRYSWRVPPSWSRRRMSSWAMRSGSTVGVGRVFRGEPWSRARCGRWVL
ncbi:helix-turn-helix domain-containing protein [Streptomyces sp. NPDC054933]